MNNNEDTVEVRTRLRKTRRLKMAYNVSQTDGTKIAAIRFSGQYLESLGFDHNGFFDLTINEDGSLTIKPVSREEADASEVSV